MGRAARAGSRVYDQVNAVEERIGVALRQQVALDHLDRHRLPDCIGDPLQRIGTGELPGPGSGYLVLRRAAGSPQYAFPENPLRP